MDKRTAAQFARSRGWLSATPETFQDAVIARADLIRLDAKQSLYAMGDDSGGLFGLVKGRLNVHLTTLGNDATLAFIGQPGIWIGDIAAVTGQKRILTVVACTECHILRLPRAELIRIVEQTPASWFHIAEMLAQNFARAIEMLEYLRCPDHTRRVAALLLSLNGNRSPEPIRVSQIEMAEMTHIGRTNVQSALVDLVKRGFVRRAYASVEIVDVAGLRNFAQTPDDD
jgi:CRP-like cAMP-binding protein